MNKPIQPAGAKQAEAGGKSSQTDWSAEIEVLKRRLSDLRLAVSSNPPPLPDETNKRSDTAAQAAMGKSLLESLAYVQTVQVRQERPKRIGRRSWRAEAFEPVLGSELLPDNARKNKEDRGEG